MDSEKIKLKFESGEELEIKDDRTLREAIHELRTPDINEELDQKLSAAITAHDKVLKENEMTGFEIEIEGYSFLPPFEVPLNVFTEEDDKSININIVGL